MSLRDTYERNALTLFTVKEGTPEEDAVLRRQRMLVANATDPQLRRIAGGNDRLFERLMESRAHFLQAMSAHI